MKSKLIIIDGLSLSGKTTASWFVYRNLSLIYSDNHLYSWKEYVTDKRDALHFLREYVVPCLESGQNVVVDGGFISDILRDLSVILNMQKVEEKYKEFIYLLIDLQNRFDVYNLLLWPLIDLQSNSNLLKIKKEDNPSIDYLKTINLMFLNGINFNIVKIDKPNEFLILINKINKLLGI